MLKLLAVVLLLFAFGHVDAKIADYGNIPGGYIDTIYSDFEDNIIELDYSSLNDTIHCKNDIKHCTAFLLQFYHSKSQLSQRFTLVYGFMSMFVASWKDLVRLGAIDCAYPENRAVCTAHGFKRMPLLKYFDRKSEAGTFGTTISTYTNFTVLLEELSTQINREYRQHPYADWPKFTPIPDFVYNSDSVWQYSGNYDEIMLVYVRDANEPVGMSTFITAYNAARGLPVRRVLKGHYLDRLFKNTEYPRISSMKRRLLPSEIDCADPDSSKQKSIFKGAMDRMGLSFEIADHEEKIYEGGKITVVCSNHTKNYRPKRNIDAGQVQLSLAKSINSATENDGDNFIGEVRQIRNPVIPSFAELKDHLKVKKTP